MNEAPFTKEAMPLCWISTPSCCQREHLRESTGAWFFLPRCQRCLSQWGGKSARETRSVITVIVPNHLSSYVNSTSSDEFCLKEGLREKIADDLSISILLEYSEVEPTRPLETRWEMWQCGMKDLFLLAGQLSQALKRYVKSE